jgi:hypothetical protein
VMDEVVLRQKDHSLIREVLVEVDASLLVVPQCETRARLPFRCHKVRQTAPPSCGIVSRKLVFLVSGFLSDEQPVVAPDCVLASRVKVEGSVANRCARMLAQEAKHRWHILVVTSCSCGTRFGLGIGAGTSHNSKTRLGVITDEFSQILLTARQVTESADIGATGSALGHVGAELRPQVCKPKVYQARIERT